MVSIENGPTKPSHQDDEEQPPARRPARWCAGDRRGGDATDASSHVRPRRPAGSRTEDADRAASGDSPAGRGDYARRVSRPSICCALHTSRPLPGSGDAGGMNVVERSQAEALADLGHEVELVTRRSSPDDPDRVELLPGVTLRHLDAGPPTPLAKSVIDDHLDEFSAGFDRLPPPDVVHSHHWMSGVAALPVTRRWGIPHVQSFHSVAALPGSPLSAGEPPESSRRVPGEALVATQSQAVVAISAAEARTVIERCGAEADRVMIVSPGVDQELFRPLAPGESSWSWPAASPCDWPRGYVLFAARLQPLKGPDLAISAMAELDPATRPHLVVAGDTPPEPLDRAMSGSTAEPVVMEAVGDGRQVRAAKLVVRTAPRGPHNDKFGGPARTPDPEGRHNDHFGGSPTRYSRSGDESTFALR